MLHVDSTVFISFVSTRSKQASIMQVLGAMYMCSNEFIGYVCRR